MSSKGQGTLDAWLGLPPVRRPEPSASPPSVASSPAPEAVSSRAPALRSTSVDPDGRSYRRGADLAAVARETQAVLPDILKQLPSIRAKKAYVGYEDRLARLEPEDCPERTLSRRVAIRVVNDDTLSAAIRLAASKTPASGRVVVLNMASHVVPGGGWLHGARAQEEDLCYRSSLYLSLHQRFYPFKQCQAIYTPDVVVIRSDRDSGHQLLMPSIRAQDLPVVSVVSVAALRTPPLRAIKVPTPDGPEEMIVFASPEDRLLTKAKMRICLRMAAYGDHGLLVLGALGCGAFRNPPREVAFLWLEVLRETEFRGGWWEEVWFAVWDKKGEGNFEVFEEILGGVEV